MHRATILVLAFLASGVAPAADLAPTGTLRVAFLRTNPVQGRVDPQTGAITGPVADLTQEFARQLGIPYKIVPAANARDVIDRMNAHTVDIGFLAFDAPRAQEVDFSHPYALMLNTYLVRSDSPIQKGADVDRAGVRVGVVQGQSQEVVLKDILKRAALKVLPQGPSLEELNKMLMNGDFEAYGANRQRQVEAAAKYPNLRVLPDNFSVAEQSIVVTKGDTARLATINQFLEKAIASGVVKTSIDRAKLTAGVQVAPIHGK